MHKYLRLYEFIPKRRVSLSCENCHKQTQYSLKQQLAILPKILIIKFKRFTYENSESKIIKPLLISSKIPRIGINKI